MSRRIVDQLAKELEQLACDYPEESIWKRLGARVRREAGSSHRSPRPRPKSPPKTDPVVPSEQLCWLCEVATPAENSSMCVDCTIMYRSVSARMAPDRCDCGHPPDGTEIYLCREGGTEESLCGRSCVKRHFEDQFRPFLELLRRS